MAYTITKRDILRFVLSELQAQIEKEKKLIIEFKYLRIKSYPVDYYYLTSFIEIKKFGKIYRDTFYENYHYYYGHFPGSVFFWSEVPVNIGFKQSFKSILPWPLPELLTQVFDEKCSKTIFYPDGLDYQLHIF